MLSAPVRRIDEILALPHSVNDFRSQEVPPADDDSWLYSGEDELNSTLKEREKELELYNSKLKSKQKSNESQNSGPSSSKDIDDFDRSRSACKSEPWKHQWVCALLTHFHINKNKKEAVLLLL